MKITPTMPREHRDSGYASPVFHPKKWLPWSDCPYHRDGAAPLKKVRLPRGFLDINEDREAYENWLTQHRAFWLGIITQLSHGVFIKIT